MRSLVGQRYERVFERHGKMWQCVAVWVPAEGLLFMWRVRPTEGEVRIRITRDGRDILRRLQYQAIDEQRISAGQIRATRRFLERHMPAIQEQKRTHQKLRERRGDPAVMREAERVLRQRIIRVRGQLQKALLPLKRNT